MVSQHSEMWCFRVRYPGCSSGRYKLFIQTNNTINAPLFTSLLNWCKTAPPVLYESHAKKIKIYNSAIFAIMQNVAKICLAKRQTDWVAGGAAVSVICNCSTVALRFITICKEIYNQNIYMQSLGCQSSSSHHWVPYPVCKSRVCSDHSQEHLQEWIISYVIHNHNFLPNFQFHPSFRVINSWLRKNI